MLVPDAITRADPATSRASPRVCWLPALTPRSSWCTVPVHPATEQAGQPDREMALLACTGAASVKVDGGHGTSDFKMNAPS
jgi:hypothetical protein